MSCELWAIDAEGGEAILKEGDRWYLSSLDHAWRPVEVEAPQGVLEWSLARHVVPVGREYGDLERAVITARRLCRAVWRAGGMSTDDVRRWLDGTVLARRPERGPDAKAWEERLPEILREAVKLDRFFQAKGCPSEESLRLTLRVLEQLRGSGEWRGLRGRDLLLRLFDAAWAIYRDTRVERPKAPETPETPETPERGLSDYDRRLFKKNLRRLGPGELSCLTLWADTSYSVEDLAILLNLSPETVQERLDRAAEGMGRPLAELRRLALAELCRAQLSGRGGD
ncbi:MAG: hypothetical protein WAM82_27260 [Thermoanaerobaculia bacterium]